MVRKLSKTTQGKVLDRAGEGSPRGLDNKKHAENRPLRAPSIHNSIQEYLTQTETKGLLYDRSFVVDAQKKRGLQKKAQVIFEAFLQTCDYADESVRTAGMGEMLRASLIEVICAMKRKSGEEYRVVNDYLAFLQDRWKVETAPLDRQLTPLERQLSIAKELHDFGQAKEFDRHKVAEKYLVSDRTIEND